MYHVTLIPGDGVGPELAQAAQKCLAATGVLIDWDVQECGIEVIEKVGKVPDSVLASIRKNKVALKAPITTPIGKGFRSVNVFLRQELGLYACLRPCKSYAGVRSFFSKVDVDLVVVRENTEDLYAGVEFQAGQPATAELIDAINAKATGKKISTGKASTGVSIKPISYEGTRNIAKFAFDYAVKAGRKSVTSVCKANIMKFTDGLWYDETRAVAAAFKAKFEQPELMTKPDTELAGKVADASNVNYMERLVDNMCMQLVQKPELYDVILLPNLYGDILSDLCAGLVGGLGVAPGANYGAESAIFEATHGSAPKYKGQNKVNPTALILSGKLMLEHLGEKAAAEKLEQAVAAVIAEGKDVTYDLKTDRNDPTAVGTQQMADAICRKIQSM
jgi:isocitrate dehydrogenase (NAD+)